MAWSELALASAIFFASHSIPIRPPVKPWIVARVGTAGFTALYAILSLAVLSWLIFKNGLLDALNTAALAHPDKTIQLWFQERRRTVAPVGPRKRNEPRVGQKGRLCHRWWLKGQRPPGRCDKRFKWTCIFGAVAPDSGEASGLVLPKANTAAMSICLAEFAKTLPKNIQAVMVLDQAGWHGAKELKVPDNVTLIALPPYSPELNPVERLWLYLRERFLSLRVFDDHDAIVDACCQAWNAAVDDAERIKSLSLQPWIKKVNAK